MTVRNGPLCLSGGRQVCRIIVHAAAAIDLWKLSARGARPLRLAVRGAKVRAAPMQPDTLGQGGT